MYEVFLLLNNLYLKIIRIVRNRKKVMILYNGVLLTTLRNVIMMSTMLPITVIRSKTFQA